MPLWSTYALSMQIAAPCCALTTSAPAWSLWMPCLATRRPRTSASAGAPIGCLSQCDNRLCHYKAILFFLLLPCIASLAGLLLALESIRRAVEGSH